MDAKEIIKRVIKIELKTRGLTQNLFSGEYHSSFKGRGMIFSEVKPYVIGDDIRSMDWNKTAHFNEPFVKVFEEERELTMLLMVDVSSSVNFGTKKQIKKETMAEVAATLAFAAAQNNDKIGLILFSNQIEFYIPPKKGRKHAFRIIREIVEFQPKQSQTNLSVALDFALKALKKSANVFLLSDFSDQNYQKNLSIFSKRHKLVGVRIFDQKEVDLPDVGWIHCIDKETQKQVFVNTSSQKNRDLYREQNKNSLRYFEQAFRASSASSLSLRCDLPYTKALLNHFKKA
ncbi:MAG: DUF58 domain-containing protein [Flavobacteriaceae bacterium]|nr:MAG: DUF58 domain-containing protein [Flavobacteriaceae bacterium]